MIDRNQRDITDDSLEAIDAQVVRNAILIEADFPSEIVRISTDIEDIIYQGNTFIGAGILLTIEAISESLDSRANGASITITGLETTILMKFLEEEYQGRPVRSWIVFLNENREIIGEPIVYFTGILDTDSIRDGGETSTITFSAENLMSDHLRPREYRYSHEDQQILNPNVVDNGLEFVTAMRNLRIRWGST